MSAPPPKGQGPVLYDTDKFDALRRIIEGLHHHIAELKTNEVAQRQMVADLLKRLNDTDTAISDETRAETLDQIASLESMINENLQIRAVLQQADDVAYERLTEMIIYLTSQLWFYTGGSELGASRLKNVIETCIRKRDHAQKWIKWRELFRMFPWLEGFVTNNMPHIRIERIEDKIHLSFIV